MWWKLFAPLSCLLCVVTVSDQQQPQDVEHYRWQQDKRVSCQNFAAVVTLKQGENRAKILDECIRNYLIELQQPQQPRIEWVVDYTKLEIFPISTTTRAKTTITDNLRPKQAASDRSPPQEEAPSYSESGGGFGGGGGGGGAGGGGNSNGGNEIGFSGPSQTAFSQTVPISTTVRSGGEPESNSNSIPNFNPISSKKFTNNLYRLIAHNSQNKNVVYSPISLETLMALTYIGATGQTANELRGALDLPESRPSVLQQYGSLPKSQNIAEFQLDMANKLYYNQDLIVKQEFENNAAQYFDAEAERVNFGAAQQTAQIINNWVLGKTHGRIQNLIQPETLDPQTSAILVNAIYFKAKWNKEFSTGDTEDDHFIGGGRQKMSVSMMNNEDVFYYLDMPKVGASVLRLPYKDTDLSMLFVLPYNINGLVGVEEKIANEDLRELMSQMQPETVKVQIPRFRVEFELDMIPTLKKLQIQRLFTDHAELNNIFKGKTAGISKVQHKAFIDVNEAGSEAAAATFNKLTPLSLPTNLKIFRADHPFMFAIVSPQAVYFMGHVVSI